MASENSQPVRIGAVLVDVHGTLVTPQHESKGDLLAKIISRTTRAHVNGTQARRRTNAIRRELNESRPEEYLNSSEYWIEVNRRMMHDLGNEVTDEQALAVHHGMMGGALYKMHPKRRDFVRWLLRRKFANLKKIVVASNSNAGAVAQTLHNEKIDGWFKEIYTSDRVLVSKPAPKFWRRVLEDLKIPPERVLMVGNSLLNDAVAARMGIHTVLILDRFDAAEEKQKHRTQLDIYAAEGAVKTGKEVLVHASEHLQRVRDYIDPHFEPIVG